MTFRFSITLVVCALAVFMVGSGIRGVEAAEERAALPIATVYASPDFAARGTAPFVVLPTVYVTATTPAPNQAAGPSVMLDAAVNNAGAVIAQGARRGVRKIGLAMPYYAFGSNARGTE